MKRTEFDAAVACPAQDTVPVQALWWLKHDGWDAAHRLVQDEKTVEAAWIHAHLHRIEGDLDNARYWYERAGRAPSDDAIKLEFNELLDALLD